MSPVWTQAKALLDLNIYPGMFHCLEQASERTLMVTRDSFEGVVGQYRTKGQLEFLFSNGSITTTLRELSSLYVGLDGWMQTVFRRHGGGNSAVSFASWKYEWSRKSTPRAKLVEAGELIVSLNLTSAASRSGMAELKQLALEHITELAAGTGGDKYLRLLMIQRIEREVESDRKHALLSELQSFDMGAWFCPWDLVEELFHARVREQVGTPRNEQQWTSATRLAAMDLPTSTANGRRLGKSPRRVREGGA